jgi:Outer membrane protein beta-barrel domain
MQVKSTCFLSLLMVVLLAGSSAIFGQSADRIYIEPNEWSVGMNVGMSDLWGDVGTKTVMDHYSNSKYLNKPCFMGGMFGRYTFSPAFDVRFQLNYGTLYATDAWNYNLAQKAKTEGDDAYQRYYLRHQDIKDNVWEPMLLFEYAPFRRNPDSKAAHRAGQPYIGAGLAYFHFQPYTSSTPDGGHFIKIYDLHLEGQGWGAGYPASYSLWQPAIPLCIGFRWDLGQHLNLGIEYMYRLTFTDYLDGVSDKYVNPSAFYAHLSPTEAAVAVSVADKSWMTNGGINVNKGGPGYPPTPNAPGSLRGDPSNKDSYSTISIVFYYKVLTKSKEWWH